MKSKILVSVSVVFMLIASIAYAGPPTPHAEVSYSHTLKDIRWAITHVSFETGANFSNAQFTVLNGPDTLSELQNIYLNNKKWNTNLMVYVRQVLANSNSKAILVVDDQTLPFIYVPWNSLTPPSFDLPTGSELVQQRGYIIPIDPTVVGILAKDRCETGEYGNIGSGAECGCIAGLGCGRCSACVSPPFIDKWGIYSTDNLLFSSYSTGNILPLYGN